jgi:hypothetical protein
MSDACCIALISGRFIREFSASPCHIPVSKGEIRLTHSAAAPRLLQSTRPKKSVIGSRATSSLNYTTQGGKWGKIVPCPAGEAPEPPRGKSNSPPPPPTEALLKMRCNAHKREDDIDVVHQRCMGSPTCRRRPVRSWVSG